MYNESPWNALFFVIFIVFSIFYLHSLVLSVVFQVFIQSTREVHFRSASDKKKSLQSAFLALAWARNDQKDYFQSEFLGNMKISINVSLIGETFRFLRPHYNQQKLNVLMDIMIPSRLQNSSTSVSSKERDDNGQWEKHKDLAGLLELAASSFLRRVLGAWPCSLRSS